MARDKALVRRNLLAIPGAILTFYTLVGLVYVLAYRGDDGICRANDLFLVAGKCYHILPFLVGGLIVGIALLAAAAAWFRAHPEFAVDRLRPGTPTHAAIAILASLVVVLGVFAAVMAYLEGLQGTEFTTRWAGVRFKTRFLLLMGAGIALFALGSLGAALGAESVRRHAFIRAAREEEDSTPLGLPPAEPQDRHPPEEFVDEAQWPKERDGESPKPAEAPSEPAGEPGDKPAGKPGTPEEPWEPETKPAPPPRTDK